MKRFLLLFSSLYLLSFLGEVNAQSSDARRLMFENYLQQRLELTTTKVSNELAQPVFGTSRALNRLVSAKSQEDGSEKLVRAASKTSQMQGSDVSSSRSGLQFSLDSIIRNESKLIFQYDEQGRQVEERLFFSMFSGGPIELIEVISFSYPTDSTMVLVFSEPDGPNGELQQVFRVLVTLNDNEDFLLIQFEDWAMNEWIPEFKIEYTYQDDLLVLEEEFYYEGMGEWILEYFYQYTYEDELIILVEVFMLLDGDEFVLEIRGNFTYDENDFLIEAVWEEAEWPSMELTPYYREVFEYDLVEMIRTSIWSFWEGLPGEGFWEPFIRQVDTMDNLPEGNVLVTTTEYAFGLDGWVMASMTENNFDFKYTFDEIASPMEYTGAKILMQIMTDYFGPDGESTEEVFYFYSDFVLSTAQAVRASASMLYPNPSVATVQFLGHFEGLQPFELYDLNGKLLKRMLVQPQQHINIADLAPGVYIYRLGEPGSAQQGKLVKQ